MSKTYASECARLPTLDRLALAVVEDDDDVRSALDRLLRSMGHEVYLFASAEAYDADPVRIDCLILDVRLPGLSGTELYERLRLRGSTVPVVFITGNSESPTGESSWLRKDIDVPSLAKPFSEDTLIDAIATAVSDAHR